MNTHVLLKWREAAFFWLGMLIIPVFWIWWTLHPRFKSWERMLAVTWTAIWLALLMWRVQELPAFLDFSSPEFAAYCAELGMWLWAFLLLRVMGIMILVFIDIIPLLGNHPPTQPQFPEHFPFELLLWVAIPLALHLVLNPARRMWRKLERMSVTPTIPPRLIRR